MTAKEQKKAAADFAAKWAGKGYEKGECQKFWRGLLHDVFEVADPDDWVQYEVQVNTGFTTKFIDAYIPRTKVPPELRKAHQANDAAVLSAYGFSPKATESEIVSKLFEMYAKLTEKEGS